MGTPIRPLIFASALIDCRRFNKGSSRGFTLIELMVTISVAAILLAIAVPSFANIAAISQLRSVSTELSAHSYLARSEAIKRNTAVRLCASASGTACEDVSWVQGWVVLAGADVIARHSALPSGYSLEAGGGLKQITYQSTGFGATGATFTACRSSPAAPEERIVTIESSGKAYVRRTTTGTCA